MDMLIPCFSSSTTMGTESKPRFISQSIDYRREAEAAGRATSPRSVTNIALYKYTTTSIVSSSNSTRTASNAVQDGRSRRLGGKPGSAPLAR